MIIPYDIIGYVTDRFQDVKFSDTEAEIRICSIFCEDRKFKLYINAESGLWICFKSQQKGNFISLVAQIEGISYAAAEQKLALKYADSAIRKYVIEHKTVTDLNLLDDTLAVPYDIETNANPFILNAWVYLFERKLLHPGQNFRVGINGVLENRLVIPFVVNGTTIFFQARALNSSVVPRYYNCKQNKKSTFLYPYNTNANYVVVCEGPLDAISLQIAGINATSIMGSSISYEQLRALKMFGGRLVAGFDNDKPGKDALRKFSRETKKMNIPAIDFIFPKDNYKDWNEMLKAEENVYSYVMDGKKPFTEEDRLLMLTSEL